MTVDGLQVCFFLFVRTRYGAGTHQEHAARHVCHAHTCSMYVS
jgi:hypothetical protein